MERSREPILFWLSSEEYTWMPDACGQKRFMTCWTIKCHFHYNLAIKPDFISILSRSHFRPNSVNLRFLSFSIIHTLGIEQRSAQTWGKFTTPWKNPCSQRSESPRCIQHLQLLFLLLYTPPPMPLQGLPLWHLCPDLYSYISHLVTPEPLVKNMVEEILLVHFGLNLSFWDYFNPEEKSQKWCLFLLSYRGWQAAGIAAWGALKRRAG